MMIVYSQFPMSAGASKVKKRSAEDEGEVPVKKKGKGK